MTNIQSDNCHFKKPAKEPYPVFGRCDSDAYFVFIHVKAQNQYVGTVFYREAH